MALCPSIHQCSQQVQNLWNKLNQTSGSARTNICQQITNHISQCLASMGRKNQVIGSDRLYFPDTNHYTDVIENCSGSRAGGAKVSCLHTPGSGSAPPPSGGGTIPGSSITGGSMGVSLSSIKQYLPLVAIVVVLLIFAKKGK